ncbi:RecA-like DNA recombinase [Arthrobacter phage KingBob]|uniref:RecA-like DNA recombinase n=1 Tax=Arthrobacter phage Sergei TaxID=2250416 RepID=A0A345KPX9_9CAUD|nr:Sak4-like ssDNA annealing protein [Arthrobacter phage Sergei]ASZ74355.1 RecA-like DNA recombinase [Arthrobacter phage Temper16]AXH44030.1 RecA-like DNA recombinase [Arthrobacter phage Herb]AXH44274.1 RecA-like DNA recombinase [Arthrobacter phage KingBob]QGJ97181.1 RecA-like DNA recombinase [Arthrobacter phage Maria1952]AXH45081.1 RecA-like DNA recombinase [Arthrobacter phage Sergei]
MTRHSREQDCKLPKAPSTAKAKNAAIAEAVGQTAIDTPVVQEPTGDDQLDDLFAPIDEVQDTYNFCFYGLEGSGKTTAIATAAAMAPEGSRILIVNAEGGVKKKALERRGIDTSNIMIWPNPNKGETVTRKGIERLYNRLKGDLARDPNSWFAVGWDSITEVHAKIVSDVAGARIQKARDRDVVISETDEFFTDRDDYGVMSKMVNDLLRKFRDLPCHFIVTALERRDVDEKTSKVSYGPAITPALQTSVLGYTDVNLYFKAADEDGPFRALVKGVGTYRTKDRMGGMPKVIAEPTMERILGYTNGDIEEESDELQKTLPAIKERKPKVSGKIRKTAAEKKADEASEEDTAEAADTDD